LQGLPRVVYPRLMREREWTIPEAANLLAQAEKRATSDPADAVPLLQDALQACRRAGVRCLETRALSALAQTLSILGDEENADTTFQEAYKFDCSCCRPIVDRRHAHHLYRLGRIAEALKCATRAVEASTEQEKGLALDTLATIRRYTGDYSGAVEADTEALALMPVVSRHHPRIRANLADALRRSGKLEDARRSERILRGLPPRFRGLKYLTEERVTAAWMLAETLALISQLDEALRPFEKRQLLREARDLLEPAVPWLERKRLPLDVAAARTDLAAIKAQLNPLDVRDALAEIPEDGEHEGKPFDISTALQAAKDAAAVVFTLERKAQLCEALKALRDATVEAGAAPPVMSYAFA